MNLHENQQEEAIARMKRLRLKKGVIDSFCKDGSVQICTRPHGEFIFPTEAEKASVQKFQIERSALVYLILRAVTIYGVLDSYLYVSRMPDNWENERNRLDKGHTYTYTVNQDHPDCSEFGSIDFSHTRSRGIVRTDIDFF